MALRFFLFLLVYMGLLLGVGLVFAKRIRDLEEFFLASRRLPGAWVFLSLSASWIGATSTLVAADEAYSRGMGSVWVMGVPAVVTVGVFAVFLARPIRRHAIFSLPDLVEARYGKTVRHLASGLIVWYMILLAASQMVALGRFLMPFLDSSYLLCLMIGSAAVLAYSVVGGFRSVVLTDGLQLLLLCTGIGGVFVFLLRKTSLEGVVHAARMLEKPEYFSVLADLKTHILMASSFVLAWIISPIAWQRIQAARNLESARRGLWGTAGLLLVFFGSILGVGMLSLPLRGPGDQGMPLLSWMISSEAGDVLGGALFVAVMAAVMSTMDTAINTGALSLAHDVFGQVLPDETRRHEVLFGRAATVLVGTAAFVVATRLQDILQSLGLASEIMAEGLFFPGVAMLYIKKKRPAAGLLSLSLGGGFAVLGFLDEIKVFSVGLPEWPHSVPYGIGLCAGGFFLGLAIDRRRERLRENTPSAPSS